MCSHDIPLTISSWTSLTGSARNRKWNVDRNAGRRVTRAFVLLLLVVAESTTTRRTDVAGELKSRRERFHRYAGEHIHVGVMSDNDCPVKPPCYCTDSVTTTHEAGGKAAADRPRWGSQPPADDVVVVVAQRISCDEFSDMSRGRRKWSRRSGSRSRSRSRTRFPRFVESNVAVERHVLLSYSGLTSIPGAAFHAIKVVELDLQGNNFGEQISPKAFVGVGERLLALNLAWSNVTRLPGKVFRGLKAVRNMSLAENHLRRLPSAIFDDLRSMERLTLAGNSELHDLPRRLFRNQHISLQHLDLGYCRLSYLPGKIFRGLTSLRKLDLRGNELSRLEPFTFTDLRSLDILLLGHNPLHQLTSRVLYGLMNLTVLRVEESRLEHIDHDVFRDVRRLETLDLSDNHLSSLSPGTLLVPTLQDLSLDGNQLETIPADVEFLRSLRRLDVSYNRLRTVDRCLFATAAAASTAEWTLEYVNLRQNPFHCDCRLFWLRALRAGVVSRWSDRRARGLGSGGRGAGSIPFVPGKCWTPLTLRGIAITNWLDLDCLNMKATVDRCNRI